MKQMLALLEEFNIYSVIFRILLATFVGGCIGSERGRHGRAAGLRTHILVCVGASMTTLIGLYATEKLGSPGDPMRMGAQVVSGIGFLGAGTIIVTKRSQIKGLTTAAGLWSAAGIGLALGIGFYEAAVVAAVAMFLILSVVHRWDTRIHRRAERMEIYLEYDATISIAQIIRSIKALDAQVEGIRSENENLIAQGSRGMILSLKLLRRREHSEFLREVSELEGVYDLEEL